MLGESSEAVEQSLESRVVGRVCCRGGLLGLENRCSEGVNVAPGLAGGSCCCSFSLILDMLDMVLNEAGERKQESVSRRREGAQELL